MTNKELIERLQAIREYDPAAIDAAIERANLLKEIKDGLAKWLEETAPDKIAK